MRKKTKEKERKRRREVAWGIESGESTGVKYEKVDGRRYGRYGRGQWRDR
jgi:hypothetical protein